MPEGEPIRISSGCFSTFQENFFTFLQNQNHRAVLWFSLIEQEAKVNLQKGDPLCVRTAFVCTYFVMVPIWSETLFCFTVFCFFCGVFQSRLQALQLQEEASDKFRSGYHLRSSVICHRRSRRNDFRSHRYFHHRKKE